MISGCMSVNKGIKGSKAMICEVSGRECPTLDEHHVIPREFGGLTGPTIRLDPAIHQAIHRYCRNPQNLGRFLSKYPAEVRARIQMLVTAIAHAEGTLERAPLRSITVSLDKEEMDRLSRLAEDMNMSETQVAKKLLSNLLTR